MVVALTKLQEEVRAKEKKAEEENMKKDNGIIEKDKLNKELNLYHQDYCGCVYSIKH